MSMDKIITEILNIGACEMRNNKTREKLETEVLEPIICFILDRLKPYILGTCAFMVSLTLLSISIIFLIIFTP